MGGVNKLLCVWVGEGERGEEAASEACTPAEGGESGERVGNETSRLKDGGGR